MPHETSIHETSMQGLRRWSTDRVDPGQRLSYWVDAICDAFLEMDCDSQQRSDFAGELESFTTASLSFNRVMAAKQAVYRTPLAIARSRQAPFYLISDASHAWRVSQDGQTALVRAGDAALVDAAKPYEFHFDQGVSCLSIQIPRPWLTQWLAQPEAKGVRCTRRDESWGGSLAALTGQLVRNLGTANDMPEGRLVDHVGAVLAACLAHGDAGTAGMGPPPRKLFEQVLSYMAQHLADPAASAAAAAQHLGVSVRTLNRVMAQRQTSFVQSFQTQRIARAALLLRQTRFANVHVGEIGRRCGFADASHFNRVFQQHRGMTPLQWRRLA